ncbi:hypothetical protein CB0940_09032 [Cercospora beticola]|uniref:Uncharacterized protein n=1 Tax=Cercospora beticola TaxID=122368 RepID=A0A2G5HHT1_CERBT|nr:hypothetical protein CB0940_09032 [Cercospora beticola]PIA92089.1 hypothetical protein CB0940_09032 [Cercospora beticola]WPB06693.1 hypothetical protein RHO25_011352 [Cercospora beticola]CAK1366608.1 unnamed protein product [Cercospora beticola]
MAWLNTDIKSTLASLPPPSLDEFDFDAVLNPSDPSLSADHTVPADAMSLSKEIEGASEAGNLTAVRQSLAAYRQVVDRPDHHAARRSLLLAIEHEHHEIVAYLLSENIPVSHVEVKQAVSRGDRIILKLLFEHAWAINKALSWDEPPALAYAVTDEDLTAWFLTMGADPNASCMMGRTPLSSAIQYASFRVVEMLFDHGGNIEQSSLLHAAIGRENGREREQMVEYLLQKGAPVNAVLHQDDRPEAYRMHEAFGLGTPLHFAAAKGYEDILRLLVRHGAKLDIKDSCGQVALERAEMEGHEAAAQFLRDQISLMTARL